MFEGAAAVRAAVRDRPGRTHVGGAGSGGRAARGRTRPDRGGACDSGEAMTARRGAAACTVLRVVGVGVALAAAALATPGAGRDPLPLSDYVDPLIGTGDDDRGDTIPGPTLPAGSIHPSPNTITAATSNAGYDRAAPLSGFAQLHTQGSGGCRAMARSSSRRRRGRSRRPRRSISRPSATSALGRTATA
ncbi:Exonuclease SbcC [Sphingomonas sp. T1]|nr:Exonuclease SbcC [Sphingomonas sp. T1]